jgi:hypothetical protein
MTHNWHTLSADMKETVCSRSKIHIIIPIKRIENGPRG